MTQIRHMALDEEPRVREIERGGHLGWPARPRYWFNANPTLVALEDGQIVGHSSYSIDSALTFWGRDVIVIPAARGRGLGRKLWEARLEIGHALGCRTFIGTTWDGNTASQRIMLGLGFHRCQTLPLYFRHNSPPADGILFIRHEEDGPAGGVM